MAPLILTATLLLAAAISQPAVLSVDPDTLAPYRPAVLTVRGKGFVASCRVLLGSVGRMVPVRGEVIDETEIRVELPAGVGSRPATRDLVVECGTQRSDPVQIAVSKESTPPSPSPEETTVATEAAPVDRPTESLPAPRLLGLDPETATAAEPFTLTVKGEDFRSGATVRVLANAKAGTSDPPTYTMVEFEAEFASENILLLDFDRGFAPSPRMRQVVVVNPNGTESAPLPFQIKRSAP